MYKVVLFDLDGTLTESGEGITKSVQYALEKLGKSEPDLEKLRIFIGPPLKEQFMKYADLDEETGKQAVLYYRERYTDIGIFENRVYEGIENLLTELKGKGYKLAVASSKPEAYVVKILEHFGLIGLFDEVIGSEIGGARTNKAEVIEETLKRLGFEKKRRQVLMIGDKEHDVYGARTCGIDCVAVSYGYGTEEELNAAKPLKIVESVDELLTFFRLTPRRKQKKIKLLWDMIYPWGLHFAVSQLVMTAIFLIIVHFTGEGEEAVYKYAVLFTGLSAIIVIPPMLYFYKKDKVRRVTGGLIPAVNSEKLNIWQKVWLLVMGASLAMTGNILMIFLQGVLNYEEYESTMSLIMEGKSFFVLVLCMGIVAPIAEEMIFRWVVFLRLRDHMKMFPAALISGLLFGIYHGNLLQAVYATALGIVIAYLLERTGNIWSCVLLHIGANTWSLILTSVITFIMESPAEWVDRLVDNEISYVLTVYAVSFLWIAFIGILVAGIIYFDIKGNNRKTRMV